ncbi:unnamed protein product, partial [Choristocarpus tenellus]
MLQHYKRNGRWQKCELSRLWEKRLAEAKSAAESFEKHSQEDVTVRVWGTDSWQSAGDLIGCGGFGKVYLVDYKGVNAAAKFPLEEFTTEDLEKELQEIKSECDHMKMLEESPYVVRLLDVVEHQTIPCVIVTEFLPGGNLRTFLNNASWESGYITNDGKRIILDVVGGMKFIHANEIVHGDLKCQNILLDGKKRAKVADFGLARVVKITRRSRQEKTRGRSAA